MLSHVKYRNSILKRIEKYPKQSRIRHCIFFLTDYIQSHFLLTLGRLDIIKIFFGPRKIRISVFYIREHTELVYILQNRVE